MKNKLLVQMELELQILKSWEKFLEETPKDVNWSKAYDAYMEQHKDLYVEHTKYAPSAMTKELMKMWEQNQNLREEVLFLERKIKKLQEKLNEISKQD